VLHEVDQISDQVILLSNGYVVAEGQIRDVRGEIKDQPMQVWIRCTRPSILASRLFELDHVVEARLAQDGAGVLVKTRDADRFYRTLNTLALDGIDVEGVTPLDDNVNSVYEYLIGGESR
jgi:ABC-2 type transport system ATP-binding protein